MTTKKKLIQIKSRDNFNEGGNSYGYSSINYAFVSHPDDGRRQATGIMTCREYVNRAVWGAANNHSVGYWRPEDAPIDFTKLRLLIVHDPKDCDVFKENLFNGKATLNVLEKVNKWKPSTITTVKHSVYKNAWLLTGPPEWLAQPQLLSMATWIMRLAAKQGPLKTDSYDALEKSLYDLLQKEGGGADIGSYLKLFWDKIYIVIKYHDEIFNGMDHKKAWIDVKGDAIGVYSGLLEFVTGNVTYSRHAASAQNQFKKLCKEHLPRKNMLLKGNGRR